MDHKSLREKVQEELKEELGISKNNIKDIKLGEIFHQTSKQYKKTWIVHPVLVMLKIDKIKLDWEAEEHRWVSPTDVKNLKLLHGFEEVIKKLF